MASHKHYSELAHLTWAWLRTMDRHPEEARYAVLYRQVIEMVTGEDVDILTSKRWNTTFKRLEPLLVGIPPIVRPGMPQYDWILETLHDSPHVKMAYKYLALDPKVLGKMLSPWAKEKLEYWIDFPTVDDSIDLWTAQFRYLAHRQFQKCPKEGRVIVFVEGLAWFAEIGDPPRAHEGRPGWESVLAQMFLPLRTLASK